MYTTFFFADTRFLYYFRVAMQEKLMYTLDFPADTRFYNRFSHFCIHGIHEFAYIAQKNKIEKYSESPCTYP